MHNNTLIECQNEIEGKVCKTLVETTQPHSRRFCNKCRLDIGRKSSRDRSRKLREKVREFCLDCPYSEEHDLSHKVEAEIKR